VAECLGHQDGVAVPDIDDVVELVEFDDAGNEWILEKNEYEIAYEGLDSDDMAATPTSARSARRMRCWMG
jgi:hypothetical protein